jgi:Molecular chaperone (small heat shock protein)
MIYLTQTGWYTNATAPAINVIETENEYKVEVAAPGMTKEDFNIKIDEDNQLVVTMEKKQEQRRKQRESLLKT